MKARVEGERLRDAIKAARRAIKSKPTIPVLACVRIESTVDGMLAVRATDLDNEVTVWVQAEVAAPGVVVVPADRVETLAHGAQVDLARDGMDLTARSAAVRGRVLGLPAEQYPEPMERPGGDLDEVPVARLAQCAPYASREETRFYLNGVCLVNGHAVATDGHTCCAAPLAEGQVGSGQIIPSAAIRLLGGLGTGAVRVSENFRSADVGSARATGKLIDGTFPDWQRVVPADPARLSFDADAFADALRSVAGMQDRNVSAVRMSVEDGRLLLAVRSETGGEATSDLPVDGEEISPCAFAGAYLARVAATFSGAVIGMGMKDAGSPAVFSCDRVRAVVMPMRV